MEAQDNKQPEFNGKDEQEAIKEASENERATEQGNDVTNPGNDLSLSDSERNFGEVSGTTFGDQSYTAKFSNIGAKNQAGKGVDSGGDLTDKV